MEDLIEALLIFKKYTNCEYPTGCEHDVLRVYVDPADVSVGDILKLDELGFIKDEELGDCFLSFKYGSA